MNLPHPILATVTEDIRDIRPPIHIPNDWLWIAYATGALALAAAGGAFWYWRKHLAHQKTLAELELEQLEKTRSLMQPDLAYSFSIAVSEVVRGYIEKRFDVLAAHLTTEEFLYDLLTQSRGDLANYYPLLSDFLQHCDLAKFARWQLSVAQMEEMFVSAHAFIERTGTPTPEKEQKPEIQPAPAAAAA